MTNLLIVDDEIIAVNALNRRMDWKKHGIEQVYLATSAKQAKVILAQIKIHLILCDIEMPNENGLQFFDSIKWKYPDVECVYITCHPEFEYVKKAIQLGSADYILKPIDYKELEAVLEKVIRKIKQKEAKEEILGYGKLWMDNQIEKAKHELYLDDQEPVVEKVKQYIKEHIAEKLNVEDIASEVYLNHQYLMRLFKKETGMSILEYITNERIRLAKELLKNTDLPVSIIAQKVGYSNYSYFNKIFKKNTNTTPSEFKMKR